MTSFLHRCPVVVCKGVLMGAACIAVVWKIIKWNSLTANQSLNDDSNDLIKEATEKLSTIKTRFITSIKDFNKDSIDKIIEASKICRSIVQTFGGCNALNNKVLVTLFYEPSTRTRCSFEAAMNRLGGKLITISDAKQSSVGKGESIQDSILTLAGYADAIVMRHPVEGSLEKAKKALETSGRSTALVNAGDGIGEHPTQALVDIFTIKELFPEKFSEGNATPLHVCMVGDLANGRTVHSLVKLLANYDVHLHYCHAPTLHMPQKVVMEAEEVFQSNGYDIEGRQSVCESLEDALSSCDVIYMTRIQKERFATEKEYESARSAFILTKNMIQRYAKTTTKVLHPLPRIDEISTDVDATENAKYFLQSENGVYVRMALLLLLCNKRN